MESIMNTEKGVCWLCGKHTETELHHVYGGVANRKLSDMDGLTVNLCWECHHTRIHGTDTEAIDHLKKVAQRTWMSYYGKGTNEFVQRYGKNFLTYWE